MKTGSPHVASLINARSLHDDELGSVTALTADNFNILKKLSIKRLILNADSMREPHWHANADELAYCISGTLLISILDNESQFSSFMLEKGQMFHINSGSLHSIENIGNDTAELIIAFSHERPEDFSLYATFGAMSNAVLGNTYDLPASSFENIKRSTLSPYIVKKNRPTTHHFGAELRNAHKFDVEAMAAPVSGVAGAARTAKSMFWPVLKNISMFSLTITADGMREPHWHPDTAEMGYVHKGEARMTVLGPHGKTDTFYLQAGDVYFIPKAYPHHIEVTGDKDIHFLIFFDQPTPGDIGLRASASMVLPDVLAATFGLSADSLPHFPFTPVDPLIVSRINPVDPQ